MKKILHIIVGLGDGGAEATLFKLISRDKINKHAVISLTDYGKYGKMLKKISVQTYVLNLNKYIFNIKAIFKIFKIVNTQKPEIIQSWMYHSDLLTCLLKVIYPQLKYVWGIRNSTYSYKDSISRYLAAHLCAFFSKFVPDKIISCSKRAYYEHISIGYSKHKFKIIFNGVDTDLFKKFNKKTILKNNKIFYKSFKNKFNPPLNKNLAIPKIGMVARFDKQKGFEVLFKSLRLLVKDKINFKCFLIGHNINYRNFAIISLIKKYKLSSYIILLGQRKNLSYIFNFLDISILSSVNGEGFPNVLIESMACGTPCVTTDVGEARFIVGKLGWISPPSDEVSLSKNIKKGINCIKLKKFKKIQTNCIKKVHEKFTIEQMCNNFQKVWKSL
jgi:glycosyltransferase involved in cell wall biosynthesis